MLAQLVHYLAQMESKSKIRRMDTGSRRLTTNATYDCPTLRPTLRLKDDYNIITQYNIRTVIITQAGLNKSKS